MSKAAFAQKIDKYEIESCKNWLCDTENLDNTMNSSYTCSMFVFRDILMIIFSRHCHVYFFLCFLFTCPMAWGGKIPYDPDFENKLSSSYDIVTVSSIKESKEERKKTSCYKEVKLSLHLNSPEIYNQGEDGACSFFATICSMLMVKSGKDHLKKMFLGQDDDFVYIKFPTPQPFGIINIDTFLNDFTGK